MRYLTYPLFLAGALLAAGCAAEQPGCTEHSECPSGQSCNFSTGACVPRGVGAFGLEVIPPNGGEPGVARQEFVGDAVQKLRDESVVLQLDGAVVLHGIVASSDNPQVALAARVLARRPSAIEGRPDVMFETETPDEARNLAHDFELWVNGGRTYSLYAEPDQKAIFPPKIEGGVAIESDQHRDLVVDGANKSVNVTGRVLNAAGVPLPFSVRVQARTDDGWKRSTEAQTCSEGNTEPCSCEGGVNACAGAFSLRVASGADDVVVLQIEPVPKEKGKASSPEEALVPKMECDGTLGWLLSGQEDYQLGDIRLPAFAAVQEYAVRLVGTDGSAVEGARVIFSTELDVDNVPDPFVSCTAHYQRTAVTDEDGKATVPLLPGGRENRSYKLEVLSPSDSPFASVRETQYDVGSWGGELQELTLPRRVQLGGTVLSVDGEPVPNVVVEAQGIDAGGGDSSDLSTTSDEEGHFVLFLDPGAYNFHFKPPPVSGVPEFSKERVQITHSLQHPFKAPAAQLLVGQVLLPDKSPAVGFTVTAFDDAPESAAEVTAVLRGTAVTSDGGWFQLLLAVKE